ncbi:MAG: carboxypeptidase regulatory-like domain-containing protein, partial [Firmicutes bacterium]|nr:carboxypeptidase regulatory-like domain-containing protein [Bacillota bacterium]
MKALKLRRITAFVMALVMLMPFICVPVFAANPTFTVENTTVTDGKVKVNLQVYENVPAFVQCEIEDLTTGVYDYYYPFGSSPKTDLLRQSSASFEVPLKECGRYNFSVFVTYNNGASGYGCEAVTVLYAPENAAAAENCGVMQTDSPSPRTADMTDDGTYIIVEDSNIGYLFYGIAPDYEVQEIAFLSADGTAVKTEDLKWDRTQNRWSSASWLKYTDFSGAVKAEIRAKRDPSKKSTLKLAIAQRGSIGSPKAEFTAYKERTYDAWFYSGSSFLNTPTYTGKLYIDGKADERNVGVYDSSNGVLLSDYITGRAGYLSVAVLNKRGWYRDGKATYGGNYSYISGMGKDDKWRTPTVYQAVRPGTVINCSFYGTEADGWSGKIVVSYTDTSEKEITLEKACSSRYGNYTASFSVPNDCMQINSIEYRLYNNYNFLAASQKTEYDALFCKGIVEFTDVPNVYKAHVNDVGYDTLMTFTNKQTGKSLRMLIDYDRITTMAGLVPGEYDYEITKSGRHIHSGTITVADEFYQTFSFGTGGLGVPEALGYVTANISSASANDGKAVRAAVALEVTTPDGKTSSTSQTAEADGTLNFGTYPQGSTIKAKISFDADNYPLIEGFTPGEITQVLGYSYNFAFNASAFKKRSVSGTVCGGTSADNKKISNANVIITQTLPLLDGTEHRVTYSGKTDENGNFKIKNVADGTPGTIEIRAAGYAPKTIALDAYSSNMGISGVSDNWTTLAGTVYLDYLGELSIVSALKKEPEKLLGADGTAAKDDDGNTIGSELGDSMLNADASLVDIDNIVISGATYRRGTDWIEECSGEQSIITFNDPSILSSAAAGGKTVTVNYIRPAYGTFNIDGELMSLRSFAVDAKFDAGRNVMAQAVAYKPKADIRVTACEKNEEGLVGFAVLSAGTISFTENGSPAEEMRILAWEGGVGELSLEPRVSDYTGSCTLYTFTVRQEDANVMRQLLRCGRPRLLDAVDTSGVFVKTNVTPRPNSVVMLGKKIPARTYSDIGLGPYSFDYIAEPYSEDVNYAVVRGVISKRDTSQLNKDMLFAVTLENKGGSGKAEFLVNGEESYSDGTWYNVLNTNHIPRPVLSTVVYALVPYKAETNTIDFDIQINTTDDGYIQKAERFNIVETVDNFDITLPEDRVHIQDKMRENGWYEGCGQLYDWLLDVDVAASKSLDKRENTITVWDNGTAIGTVDAENLNGVTRCGFKLTNMFAPGTHVIYATRETAVGNTYSVVSTPKRTVEVSADEKEIYVTDMVWYHNGQARSGGTMSVNPKVRSIIIFKVNGALSTDLDEVYVHTDAGVSIPAYCYYNDSAKNSSWWAIGGGAGIASDLSTFRTGYEGYLDSSRVLPVADKWGVMLGTAKDFTVDIGYTTPEKSSADRETLREQALRNYYDLMGLEVPDYDKRLEAIEEWKNSEDNDLNAYIESEKQSMPSEIAELEYSLDVSADGKTFTYTAAPTASVSSATLVMKFGDEKEYKLSELYTRLDKEREGDITEDAGFDVMWSAAESAQGLTIKRFAVKNEELLVNGKKQYHSIMHETLYLPSEVRDAMYEAAGANNVFLDAYSDDDAPLTVLADEDAPLSVYAAKKTKAKTDDDGDPMLKTAYDYTNEVYAVTDLVNAAKTSNAIVESAALGNTAAQIEADAKAAGFIPDSVGYVAKGLCVVDTAYNIHKVIDAF